MKDKVVAVVGWRPDLHLPALVFTAVVALSIGFAVNDRFAVLSYVLLAVSGAYWMAAQTVEALEKPRPQNGLLLRNALIVLLLAVDVAFVSATVQSFYGVMVGIAATWAGLSGVFVQLRRMAKRQAWQYHLATVLLMLVVLALVRFVSGDHLVLFALVGVLVVGLLIPLTLNLGFARMLDPGDLTARVSPERLVVGGLVVAVLGTAVSCLVLGHVSLALYLAATTFVVMLAVVLVVQFDAVAVAVLVVVICQPITADPRPRPSAIPVGSTRTLVSLGDSYMSGEGAPAFYAGTNGEPQDHGDGKPAKDNQCRQAPTAWAALVSKGFDSFDFLACSGARTYEVDSRPQDGVLLNQLAQYRKDAEKATAANPDFAPALVVVSIGGNDAGFSDLAQACIIASCADPKILSQFTRRLENVQAMVTATYFTIEEQIPGARIVAIPYPLPFDPHGDCSALRQFSQAERDAVNQFVTDLDARIEAAASAAGVEYLGAMKDSLADAHEQLCGSADDGLNYLHAGSVNGLAYTRLIPTNWIHDSFHPNAIGHRAMAATFTRWYDAAAPVPAYPVKPVGDVTTEEQTAAAKRLTAKETRDAYATAFNRFAWRLTYEALAPIVAAAGMGAFWVGAAAPAEGPAGLSSPRVLIG